MRPFISRSCSREHDRLNGGASVLCLVRVRPVNPSLRPMLEIEKGPSIPQKGVSVRRTGQTTTGPTPARPGDWAPTADRASGRILGRFEAGGGGPASDHFPMYRESPNRYGYRTRSLARGGVRGGFEGSTGRGARGVSEATRGFTGRIRGRSNHSRTGLASGDAESQEGGPVPRRVPE
jgi:hypothetical protein